MKERNNLIMTLTDSVKRRLGDGYSVSIHEALLIPASFVDTPLDLVVIVRLVNKTEVSEEEILSDNVYYYSKETNEITLI